MLAIAEDSDAIRGMCYNRLTKLEPFRGRRMTSDTIREMLDRDPFEPFRIATSGGESFIIRDPHTVALMRSEVFIAEPKSDRRSYVPLLHVVTVETLGNGHTRRQKRRG